MNGRAGTGMNGYRTNVGFVSKGEEIVESHDHTCSDETRKVKEDRFFCVLICDLWNFYSLYHFFLGKFNSYVLKYNKLKQIKDYAKAPCLRVLSIKKWETSRYMERFSVIQSNDLLNNSLFVHQRRRFQAIVLERQNIFGKCIKRI